MPTKTSKPKGKKQGEFDNANRGVLFPNDKQGNDNRPDYTGKLTLKADDYEVGADGNIELRLAAWISQSDRVGEYLRISASVPQASE